MSTSTTEVDSSIEYKSSGKYRRWQITLNQVDKYDAVKAYLTGLKSFRFLIACKEKAPTTEHEHIHIYACFNHSIKMSNAKLCGAHIERCFGDHQSNMDYIKKDGNVIDEIGKEPAQGSFSQLTVGELRKISNPDELPSRYIKQWRECKRLNQRVTAAETDKSDIIVYYIWGPSAVGKSKKVAEMLGVEEYDEISYDGHFFVGVSEDGLSTNCWYDDFRDSDMKPSTFIKFIDYRAHQLFVKGSNVLNKYKKIYITSIQSPEEIYSGMKDQEPRRQWLRRMNIIHLENIN